MHIKQTSPTTSESVQPKEENQVTVYVWSSGLNSLGHVSLQLDGETFKYKADDRGDYLSIWPSSTPAGGLSSIWPLKGTSSRGLEDDCKQEAIRSPEDFSNLMEPAEILPVPPDQVFVVQGIDKIKIKEEFDRIKKGLETGDVRYQLLPDVKVANLFFNPKEIYNCVTLTEHLLKVGGVENLTQIPWKTPSRFAAQLREQPQVAEICYSTPEHNENDTPVAKPVVEYCSASISDESSREWGSDNYDEQETTKAASEAPESKPAEEEPRLKIYSESSLILFKQYDEPKSYLPRRAEESDDNYYVRMDALGN